MGFYDLSKEERVKLVSLIKQDIADDLSSGNIDRILGYFSDEDTYIRKAGYQATGKIYRSDENVKPTVIKALEKLLESDIAKVRQTTIYAAGEIGITDFKTVENFFNKGLFDHHHSVRNAVIGSIKKMGEKNPQPVLNWAGRYLHHQNKEIRVEICHGLELRGRTHPQDILPMLKELQHDESVKVRKMLVHVLGQISYKKGCLETVIRALNNWDNKDLVEKALDEIAEVHSRYKNFAFFTRKEAIEFIHTNYKK
jgi:hypothetical protein